jgi:hypothetical protein
MLEQVDRHNKNIAQTATRPKRVIHIDLAKPAPLRHAPFRVLRHCGSKVSHSCSRGCHSSTSPRGSCGSLCSKTPHGGSWGCGNSSTAPWGSRGSTISHSCSRGCRQSCFLLSSPGKHHALLLFFFSLPSDSIAPLTNRYRPRHSRDYDDRLVDIFPAVCARWQNVNRQACKTTTVFCESPRKGSSGRHITTASHCILLSSEQVSSRMMSLESQGLLPYLPLAQPELSETRALSVLAAVEQHHTDGKSTPRGFQAV